MIRFSNLYLPSRLFLIVALDGLLMAMAVYLAFAGVSTAEAVLGALSAATMLVGCFYIFDLYDLDATRKTWDVLRRGLRAMGTGFLLLIPFWTLLIVARPSYRILEINLVLFLVLLCAYRTATEWLHDWVFPGEKLLLVGSDPSIQLLADALKQHISLPLKLSAIVPDHATDRNGQQAFAMCEDITRIPEITRTFHANRVAIAGTLDANTPLADELLDLRRRGVHIHDASALYATITGRVPVAFLDVRRLVFGRGLTTSPIASAIHQVFGCAFSILALLLTAPAMAIIAICIKLESRGPILYMQERVGLNGETFHVYKFRSMRQDAEATCGPAWATDNDPRVTRIGRILRTLRLDELPQFFNVLRGEMSLVGPRPERQHFVNSLKEQIPFYNLRHSIRPGITGWAQVSAGYGSTVEESQKKLEYDLFYLLNRSLLLDTLIVVKTVKIMLCGKGAR
jgi:exopolysaccharide biosynthesis polyprenyl glycosylphosphotransferase